MISKSALKPLACWRGKDLYDGQVLETVTVIFRTAGCSWNRCLMCGYRHERYPPLSESELVDRLLGQIAWVKESFADDDYQMLKIFTSGSFFDPAEVPAAVLTAASRGVPGQADRCGDEAGVRKRGSSGGVHRRHR